MFPLVPNPRGRRHGVRVSWLHAECAAGGPGQFGGQSTEQQAATLYKLPHSGPACSPSTPCPLLQVQTPFKADAWPSARLPCPPCVCACPQLLFPLHLSHVGSWLCLLCLATAASSDWGSFLNPWRWCPASGTCWHTALYPS